MQSSLCSNYKIIVVRDLGSALSQHTIKLCKVLPSNILKQDTSYNSFKGIRGLLKCVENNIFFLFIYLRKVLFNIYLIFSETCRANKDL